MAKNRLTDLNDILFDQLNKLQNDEGDFATEIERANATAKIADQIVKTHKVVLDAARLSAHLTTQERKSLPDSFGIKNGDEKID